MVPKICPAFDKKNQVGLCFKLSKYFNAKDKTEKQQNKIKTLKMLKQRRRLLAMTLDIEKLDVKKKKKKNLENLCNKQFKGQIKPLSK